MVAAVCGLLFAGYPVALTLGGVSLAFAALGHVLGAMDIGLLYALPQRIFGVMTNAVLLAIPLFIFMGVMLERSRIAEDLLETMGRLFGSLPGGLGISVVLVGVLLAAAKGVVGATVVTIALITLPTMLRHGYDPRLAAGTVAATATLAQILPPATVLVLLGDQLNNSYQAAQLAKGVFAPESVSVSDLFAGAIVPGLTLVALYILFLLAVAVVRPAAMPPIPPDPAAPTGTALFEQLARVLLAPVLLIVVVLGSILIGLATPTEAAAVGAVGAILLAALRSAGAPGAVALCLGAFAALMFVRAFLDARGGAGFALALILMAALALGLAGALRQVWRAGYLTATAGKTTQMTAMIFLILIGATLFSLVFRGLGGDGMVHRALSNLPGGAAGAILAVMAAMFLLGFVMDAFEIIFVVVPIVAPPLLAMEGVDPVWLGILMAVNLQTSYMHPPLGPTLFFLRGVAPPEITTRHIYVGIIPFVVIQLFALIVLWFVPGLATWLPRLLYGG
ncbi:MAG: TRAP transporter large permease subunit [Alphaproteobacteria bacterium]|nr:MAG: TRAP transporter large permease subunit [Alphaproteobacteria bacterium]